MKCGLTAVDLAVTKVRIYATLCIPHLYTMQMIVLMAWSAGRWIYTVVIYLTALSRPSI